VLFNTSLARQSPVPAPAPEAARDDDGLPWQRSKVQATLSPSKNVDAFSAVASLARPPPRTTISAIASHVGLLHQDASRLHDVFVLHALAHHLQHVHIFERVSRASAMDSGFSIASAGGCRDASHQGQAHAGFAGRQQRPLPGTCLMRPRAFSRSMGAAAIVIAGRRQPFCSRLVTCLCTVAANLSPSPSAISLERRRVAVLVTNPERSRTPVSDGE